MSQGLSLADWLMLLRLSWCDPSCWRCRLKIYLIFDILADVDIVVDDSFKLIVTADSLAKPWQQRQIRIVWPQFIACHNYSGSCFVKKQSTLRTMVFFFNNIMMWLWQINISNTKNGIVLWWREISLASIVSKSSGQFFNSVLTWMNKDSETPSDQLPQLRSQFEGIFLSAALIAAHFIHASAPICK